MLGGKILPVFPCLANKKPATPHGFKDATADPAAIRELWRSHCGPLVGLPTGERSGLDVLDIDLDGLSWFGRNRNRLPLTRMHQTRSGGRHLFFQHQPGLRCSTSKIELGVDVRADGGYVIWWPASGGRVLCERPIANLPQWILEALTIPRLTQTGGAGCELSGLSPLSGPNRGHPSLCPTRNLTRRTQRILRVVENAPVGVHAGNPLFSGAAAAEHPFKHDAWIDLHRQRRGRRGPVERIHVSAAVAWIARAKQA